MGRIGKSLASILILIMVISSLSLIIIKPAYAQTATPNALDNGTPIPIPVPSVPEFTVKFVNSSYEVPASSSINPYTGRKVPTPSYYVENDSIELTIKNQPFVSFIDDYGANISLFYNVREKGHYAENWTDLYNPEGGFVPQSNSGYTVISCSLGLFIGLSSGGQVDFQAQAMIGFTTSSLPPYSPFTYQFVGKTSDWSNTQTVTIPASSTSTSTSPTPTVPEFPSLLVILIVFIAVSSIAVPVTVRKSRIIKAQKQKM
jgi:uncharacterized membrane protein YkgB